MIVIAIEAHCLLSQSISYTAKQLLLNTHSSFFHAHSPLASRLQPDSALSVSLLWLWKAVLVGSLAPMFLFPQCPQRFLCIPLSVLSNRHQPWHPRFKWLNKCIVQNENTHTVPICCSSANGTGWGLESTSFQILVSVTSVHPSLQF